MGVAGGSRIGFMTSDVVEPYTTGEVARLFNVDPKTVNRWANAGKFALVFKTPGGHLRFPRQEIDAIVSVADSSRVLVPVV